MPKEYGIPKDRKGLLPWSHVTERMETAKHYWIATSGPDGAPHATPVDGVWIEDRLYFGGSPQTKWRRNLAANQAACLHLADPTDVVILHGEAQQSSKIDRAMLERIAEESNKKYGYGMSADQLEALGGVLVFAPRVVMAWKAFPKDATRWEFSGQ
ncbi:MAG: pyridoxamine 5'-phosphate oxidase family protein [Blastocatellia bacterium]